MYRRVGLRRKLGGVQMHDGGGGGGDFGGGFSGHHGGDFGHHGGHSGGGHSPSGVGAFGAGGHNRHHVGGAVGPPDPGDFARHLRPYGGRGRAPLRTRRVFRLVIWAIIIGAMIWTFVH